MSKFKIGDTAIVISKAAPSLFGTKFEVKRLKESVFGGFLVYEHRSGSTGWHEDALVSEEVFNSTLNHAMKED